MSINEKANNVTPNSSDKISNEAGSEATQDVVHPSKKDDERKYMLISLGYVIFVVVILALLRISIAAEYKRQRESGGPITKQGVPAFIIVPVMICVFFSRSAARKSVFDILIGLALVVGGTLLVQGIHREDLRNGAFGLGTLFTLTGLIASGLTPKSEQR